MRIYELNKNGVYSPSGVEYEKFKHTHLDLGRISRAYSQWVKKCNIPFIFEGIETPECIGYGKKVFNDSGFRW